MTWTRQVCLLTIVVFLWSAMVTFDPGDWPSPNQYPHFSPARNACGVVGAWIAYQLKFGIGDGAYLLLLFLSMVSLVWVVRGEVGHFWQRVFGITLVVLCTSTSTHLIAPPAAAQLPVGAGGVLGYAMGETLTRHLSHVGTLIILASSLIVGLVFASEGWVLTLPALVRSAAQASARAAGHISGMTLGRNAAASNTAGTALDSDGTTVVMMSRRRSKRSGRVREGILAPAGRAREGILVPADKANLGPSEGATGRLGAGETDNVSSAGARASGRAGRNKATEGTVDDDRVGVETHALVDSATPAGTPSAVPIINFPSPQEDVAFEPYPRQIENWRLPSLGLLTKPEYGCTEQQETMVREQAQVLERTLEDFRLDAHVVAIDTGPVITMFELRLGAGIKVSQVATLSNDIARALKAPSIRVVAPIPGKNTIGIEVPNIKKEPVLLRELMGLAGKRASQMGLPLFLGKDAGGAALVADLRKMPHLLIAGTTGSGKSVGLNSMIVSLLMAKRPDHVKMILIDPKMVEMSQFKDIPHLMCPIVTDMVRAERILDWAVTKMEERYALLAEARVKHINAYNDLGPEGIYERLNPATDAERARIVTHLPYIVIIIDELADLMMTAGKEVEHHLSRLAQKSRAVGLHIIVATQRPEAKVVTGLIKSNLPSRICFRVSSRMDSRIVLDQNGGEVLMGAGDMLFLPPGSHKLIRAQGTFVHEREIEAVIDDLTSRAAPEFHPELMRIKSPNTSNDSTLRDPLFDKAVMVVLESKRGSVSLLQRALTIGYSRASRLIDQMADAGIVGTYKGSQAREVHMTVEEWRALKQQVAEDVRQGYEADAEEVAC